MKCNNCRGRFIAPTADLSAHGVMPHDNRRSQFIAPTADLSALGVFIASAGEE